MTVAKEVMATRRDSAYQNELPPISWARGIGSLDWDCFMDIRNRANECTALRRKHDIETRKQAVEFFECGLGCRAVSSRLPVPRDTVKERLRVFHMSI